MSDEHLPRVVKRRDLLATVGAGVAAIGIGSVWAQARTDAAPLQVLTEAEKLTLEALGDTLLPGAAAAGVAFYVDAQLASAAPLLMLKYLDVPLPAIQFYRDGLRAAGDMARSRFARAFHEITADQRSDLVREFSSANPAGWSGPPAPLFYFALRADAIDVYYGTEQGFAALGIPYMAHIAPPASW